MLGTIIALLGGLVGIALGGGVRAWETERNRKKEAASLLSALVAEVEAVSRLAKHRRFMEAMIALRDQSQRLIDEGRGDEPGPFMIIFLTQRYFETYEASVSKIGLLEPYHADRITRFYTYAKAALENYQPTSPHHGNVTAFYAVLLLENDIQLMETVTMLGEEIAGLRKLETPEGASVNYPLPVEEAPPAEAISGPTADSATKPED